MQCCQSQSTRMPSPAFDSSQAVWHAAFWLIECWTCAVLPDLEHWDDHFAHVRFDGDPTEDVPSIARLSEDVKHRVAGMYLLIRGRAWVIYPP